MITADGSSWAPPTSNQRDEHRHISLINHPKMSADALCSCRSSALLVGSFWYRCLILFYTLALTDRVAHKVSAPTRPRKGHLLCSHLFLSQLDLTLLNDVFFVQQLLLLTFKVVFALQRKTQEGERRHSDELRFDLLYVCTSQTVISNLYNLSWLWQLSLV